jgi:hypothetical protein
MNEFTPDDEIRESLARDYLPAELHEDCAVFGKRYFRAAGKFLLAFGALAGAMASRLADEYFPPANNWLLAALVVLFVIGNRSLRRVEKRWFRDVRQALGIVKAEPR